MPVRNESWCLGLTARAALMWCDELVMLDHASTDQTREIMNDLAGEFFPRVSSVVATDPIWDEMQHRQRLLQCARFLGGTHFAIIDADELLTGNLIGNPELDAGIAIHRSVRGMARTWDDAILQLPGYNLRHGIAEYHNNGVWGNRWFSTAFKDDPRLNWAGDCFHHREPMGAKLQPYRPIQQGQGGTMHLWGASERRLIAKHALYKVTETLRWPGKSIAEIEKMYSLATKGDPQDAAYGTPETWTYSPVPESWWAPYKHLMHHLDLEQEPWQEAEVRRLVAEHGRERFAGLDLFGVC